MSRDWLLTLVQCSVLVGMLALTGPASAASTGVAWGGNAAGQLGDGTDTGPEGCTPGAGANGSCSLVPVAVGGLSEAKSIAAGGGHGLALLSDGTVMSWGSNGGGQLGAGEIITTGPSSEGLYFQHVSGPEACGGAELWEAFPCSTTPVAIGGLSEVTQIAAGGDFSLALLKNGTVMAWGRDEAGVLGNLTTGMSTVPAAVGGLREVTQIAAGSDYALALLKDGTVMAWGGNEHGQLGDGSSTEYTDVPVAVSGLSEVTQVAAGGDNSLALLKDGTVMAWGANAAGQPGGGATTASDVPVAISAISEATAIAAGSSRFGDPPGRSLALLKNGTVMAWGENEEGELGDGTETNSDVPVAVCAVGEQAPCARDLSGVTAIAAGSGHTLALLTNGTVVAWGQSSHGQLGDGYENVVNDATVGSDVPVPVDGLSEASAISAGGDFSLAIGALAPLPSVAKLQPESGPAGGGTSVTIRGSNFTGVSAVRFGSVPARFTVDSETEITAVLPPTTGAYAKLPSNLVITPPGMVYVTVQTSAGTSPASTGGDLFFYGPAETATSTGSGAEQSGGLGAASSGSGASPGSGSSSSVLGVSALGHPAGGTIAPTVLTRAQKLAKALKRCNKDKSKSKAERVACAKHARRKYAIAARKASKQKRRGATAG